MALCFLGDFWVWGRGGKMRPTLRVSKVAFHPVSNHVTLWFQQLCFILVEIQSRLEKKAKCEIYEICSLGDVFI